MEILYFRRIDDTIAVYEPVEINTTRPIEGASKYIAHGGMSSRCFIQE